MGNVSGKKIKEHKSGPDVLDRWGKKDGVYKSRGPHEDGAATSRTSQVEPCKQE